jgi:hypothetical protein
MDEKKWGFFEKLGVAIGALRGGRSVHCDRRAGTGAPPVRDLGDPGFG